MSWLSDRTGVHWNLRPYAAAAGGVLGGMVGGPLGAGLGAALFKTTDNKAHGDSWQHALEQGALNGALAYGAGSLGSHMGGPPQEPPMPGVQFTPSSATAMTMPGPGGSALTLAPHASPVTESVMGRVMGGANDAIGKAGSFVKNNRGTLETLGSTAEGIAGLASKNRQDNMQQQMTDAQTAQIQAQIARQNNQAKAFQQLYGYALAPTGGAAGGAPGGPSAAHAMLAPASPSRVVVDGEQDPSFSAPASGSPSGPTGISSGPSSTPTAQAIAQRLGYMPPPGQNDYTQMLALYGMGGMGQGGY